jgi:hypothetical protein
MSNTYILPPVVFAFVPGMGTVVSKRTAPSFPSGSIENASVAGIAAANMLTAVHNNVRYLSIASLPCFFVEPVLSALGYHCPFWIGFQPKVYADGDILIAMWQWRLEPLGSTSAW